MTSKWSIDLCADWERIGYIDKGYTFNGVNHEHEQGEWSLASTDASIEWTQDAVAADVDTVRLCEGNRLVYGGFVRAVSEGVGGLQTTVDANGIRYVWSGPDLWSVFAQRLVFPDPAVEATAAGWALSHDLRTGEASTMMAEYIAANLGNTALAARQFPGLGLTDQGEGISDDWSGRLQPLSEIIARLCHDGELNCRPSIDFIGTFSFFVGLPRNLSDRIVLSDQGDLSSATIRHVPASATFVVAGGQGTGASRVFRVATTGATGAARIEQFVDASALSSAAEVQTAANTALRMAGERWSIQVVTADEATQRWQVGVDMNIGDTISVEIGATRYRVPITAATYDITAERQIVRPTLGEATSDELKGLLRDVGNLAARFDTTIA